MKPVYNKYIVFFFLASQLFSCSVEKTSGLSKIYHNTSSRYNSYFYAKENLRTVEFQIERSLKNDYDEILPIFAPIDSSLANGYADQIEEAIKMASIGIQRHPNSKWVDDSYLLIGLARLYSLDFVNAINTFKYINTKSDNDNTRHRALIYLIRTFSDYGEYANAVAVIDYLEKQDLNDVNKKLFYIYKAYYFQEREDLDNMLTSMVNAAPELGRKDGRGRFYFILGQNYQALGFNAEAYNFYEKCLGTNPEYELDFYARLNMAQVIEIETSSDIKSSRKKFKKLLKDKKNVEFKDKIYFEMAEFELRNNNLNLALEYFSESAQVSRGNNKQKGLSYLRLGQLNYDSIHNYQLAQAYYDSCVSVLPRTHQLYQNTKERSDILNDFVSQLNTIQLQDSLLNLAQMDSIKLRNKLITIVENQREEESKRKEKQKMATPTNNVFTVSETGGTSLWYFGNLSAVALGETEFKRIWGDLQLTDNWRRSFKDAVQDENNNQEQVTENASTQGSVNQENEKTTDVGSEVERLFKGIPRTPDQKFKALELIETAYYRLGNIYHFDLDESKNAAETFTTLLGRFPETQNKVEIMYLLYLIHTQLEEIPTAEKYKNILITEYPKTTYARLILNPNYMEESSLAAEYMKNLYDSAYRQFQAGFYDTTKTIIKNALLEHNDLEIANRFRLLNILITGKTEDITKYQYQLGEFIKNYPDSPQVKYAEKLLQASRDFQDRSIKEKGVKFQEFFDQEHFLIILYNPQLKISGQLSKLIDQFNAEKFQGQALNASNLLLNDDYNMTMVTQFPGAKSSLNYYERLKAYPGFQELFRNQKFEIFTITKDNFGIFYKTKEINGYIQFFGEYY